MPYKSAKYIPFFFFTHHCIFPFYTIIALQPYIRIVMISCFINCYFRGQDSHNCCTIATSYLDVSLHGHILMFQSNTMVHHFLHLHGCPVCKTWDLFKDYSINHGVNIECYEYSISVTRCGLGITICQFVYACRLSGLAPRQLYGVLAHLHFH